MQKACKSCRSRQELSNEYFLAKFGVDLEEKEPSKVCSFWLRNQSKVRYRTFQLRPSALEAPESCREYRDDLEYIAGWRAWYKEIDRAGSFWTEAEKKAKFAFSSGSSSGNEATKKSLHSTDFSATPGNSAATFLAKS